MFFFLIEKLPFSKKVTLSVTTIVVGAFGVSFCALAHAHYTRPVFQFIVVAAGAGGGGVVVPF